LQKINDRIHKKSNDPGQQKWIKQGGQVKTSENDKNDNTNDKGKSHKAIKMDRIQKISS
jgi:hypothetical protein